MSSSPDFLEERDKNFGTKHANKRPLLIVGLLALLPLSVWVYGYTEKWEQAYGEKKQETEVKKLNRYSTPAVTKPEGPDVVLPPSPPPEIFAEPPKPFPQQAPGPVQVPDHVRERREAIKAAMHADATVPAFAQYGMAGPQPMMPALPPLPAEIPDQNRQQEKKDFLESLNNNSPYLRHSKLEPRSETEIMAGTMIPCNMVTGVNSDLPGPIIGQVAENVYDSATRKRVLIPSGAKLLGTYDSRVSAGQERVLVAWNRIIFPDSSSLLLDAMPGADRSGFAGMKDQVNNHYWKTFGNAFLVSLFSAAIRLSQPTGGGSAQGGYTSQEILAADIGRHLGQLGMQVTQRNLGIQPTLEVRPGAKCTVMLTKDVELPEWKGHRG